VTGVGVYSNSRNKIFLTKKEYIMANCKVTLDKFPIPQCKECALYDICRIATNSIEMENIRVRGTEH